MTSRLRALSAEVDSINLVTSEELNERAQKFLQGLQPRSIRRETLYLVR